MNFWFDFFKNISGYDLAQQRIFIAGEVTVLFLYKCSAAASFFSLPWNEQIMEVISYMAFGDWVQHQRNDSTVSALWAVVCSILIWRWTGSRKMGQDKDVRVIY